MSKIDLSEIPAEGLQKFSQWFERFSEQTVGSPMYRYLSKMISEDTELLRIAGLSKSGQPAPNLFLAAINYLLYKHSQSRLCQFYPNHNGTFTTEGLFQEFKSFCLRHREEIESVIRNRLVQTNEVQRCALLIPALSVVQNFIGGVSMAIVDVGTSSGLNLLLDKYSYRYSDGTRLGSDENVFVIDCEKRGVSFPSNLPRLNIKERLGIDLNPIDLKNADELLWSLSLLWPDQIDRYKRMMSAVNVLKTHPIQLFEGSANDLLQQQTQHLTSEVICVSHSFTLNQFSAEDRKKFEDNLALISQNKEIWRISLEWIGTEQPELTLQHFSRGKSSAPEVLAICHQHGQWIEWKNPSCLEILK